MDFEQELKQEIDIINERLSKINSILDEYNSDELVYSNGNQVKKSDLESIQKPRERVEREKKRLEQMLVLLGAEIVAYRDNPEGEDFRTLEWAHKNRLRANVAILERDRYDGRIEHFSGENTAGPQKNIEHLKIKRKEVDSDVQELFEEYKEKRKDIEAIIRRNIKNEEIVKPNVERDVSGGKADGEDEDIIDPYLEAKYQIPPHRHIDDPINLSKEFFKEAMEDYHNEITQINAMIRKVESDILSAIASGDKDKLKKLEGIKSRLYEDRKDFYNFNRKLRGKIDAEVKILQGRQKTSDGSKLSDNEEKKLKMLIGRSWELTKLELGVNSNNRRHRVYDDIPSLDEVLATQEEKVRKGAKSSDLGKQRSKTEGHEAHNRRVTNQRRDLNKREKEIRQRMAEILGIPVSDNIENEYEHNMRFQLDDYEVDEIQELRKELKSLKSGRAYSNRKNKTIRKENDVPEEEKPKNRKTLKKPGKNGRKTFQVDIGMLQGLFLKIINFLKKFFKEDGFLGNMLENAKEGILASGARVLTLSEEGKTSFKEVKDNIKLASRKKVKELQIQKAKKTKNTKKTKKRSIKRSTVETIKSNVKGMFGGKKSANKSANKEKPKVRTSKPKIKVVKESNLSEAYKHDLTWIKDQIENNDKDYDGYFQYGYRKLRAELDEDISKRSKGKTDAMNRKSAIKSIMKAEGISRFFDDDYDTILCNRLLANILDIAEYYKIDIKDKPIEEVWDSVMFVVSERNAQYQMDLGKVPNKAKTIIYDHSSRSTQHQMASGKVPSKAKTIVYDYSSDYTREQNNLLWLRDSTSHYTQDDVGSELLNRLYKRQSRRFFEEVNNPGASGRLKTAKDIMEEEDIMPFFKDDTKTIIYSRLLVDILNMAETYGIDPSDKSIEEIWNSIVYRYKTNQVSKKAREPKVDQSKGNDKEKPNKITTIEI